jgi:hypothetical protein
MEVRRVLNSRGLGVNWGSQPGFTEFQVFLPAPH